MLPVAGSIVAEASIEAPTLTLQSRAPLTPLYEQTTPSRPPATTRIGETPVSRDGSLKQAPIGAGAAQTALMDVPLSAPPYGRSFQEWRKMRPSGAMV